MPILILDEMFPKRMSAQKRRHLERRMPSDMSADDDLNATTLQVAETITPVATKPIQKRDWENRKVDRRNMPVKFL
jgi:hypothetical protein